MGETRVGPSLHGLIGRRAGELPEFNYSQALKQSAMTWNTDSLDRWLTDTNGAVPGSVMNFKQADAVKRKAIIDYLVENSGK